MLKGFLALTLALTLNFLTKYYVNTCSEIYIKPVFQYVEFRATCL